MKFYLEKNWSEQFNYNDETPGFFVGRQHEINGLKSIISNNDSSTILISSVRGVGKTSFVHRTLHDIKDKIIPFFVNIGHTLSIKDIKKDKKKILVSIIRNAYLNDKKDNDIKKLYFDGIGETCEINEFSKSKKNENSDFIEIKPDINTIITVIGLLLIGGSTASSWNPWIRFILTISGFVSIFFSKKIKWLAKEVSSYKTKNKIDDSTDYLEIKFDEWLRKKTEKEGKKLVFVIDELDKIETKKAFKYISEYKNLFTRSKGHFIFISSQDAYDLTQKDRSSSIKDGGVFPTFFTHVFYLALPNTTEIRAYLEKIIIKTDEKDNQHNQQRDNLINYLLFKSGNDFFELKRLISDMIFFEEDGTIFIDTTILESNDVYFSKKVELFKWVDKWLIEKNWSQLKINWKRNSEFQKDVLDFLNKKYPNNFYYYKDSINKSTTLKLLVDFLVNIGHYGIRDVTDKDEIDESQTFNPDEKVYFCTNKYNRSVDATLTKEDKSFIISFEELIKIANDLGDYLKVLDKGKFSKYNAIYKDSDGEIISGINLYSVYSDFAGTYQDIKKSFSRIKITTETVVSATKAIDEQLNNVKSKYFDVLSNLIDNYLVDEKKIFGRYTVESTDYSIDSTFQSLPNLVSNLLPENDTAVWCNSSGKYVLIIKDFQNELNIGESLKSLRNNKNLLVLNIKNDKEFGVTNPKINIRRRSVLVNNFVNLRFNDFRQFVKVIKDVEKHLNN